MSKKKNLKQKLKEVHAEVEEIKTAGQTGEQSMPADGMLFHKENYILMGAGLVLILIGFVLMAGGKSPDPNVYDYDALFGFRRITLAPILVLLGFAVEGYAIFKTPKKA